MEASKNQLDGVATASRKKKRKKKNKNKGNADGDEQAKPASVPAGVPKQQASIASKGENGKKKRKRKNKNQRPTDEPDPTADNQAIDNTGIDKKNDNTNDPNIPLLERYQQFMSTACTPHERDHFFSNTAVTPERRAALWMDQADVGEALVNEYAWAIPDARAMRILRHFSPLIEIGCGSNAYWCRWMQQAGIDIIGYDTNVDEGGQIVHGNNNKLGKKKKRQHQEQGPFVVRQGGPKVLATPEIQDSNRTLFLCYCDEDAQPPPATQDVGDDINDAADDDDDDDDDGGEDGPQSLGSACLQYYTGQYVIHVGELYGDTLSLDQAPWGRSSSPHFQQQLAAQFHCLLRVSLPNWLHVQDTMSVWKRSEICTMVFAAGDSDNDEHEGDDDDNEDEEVEYKHIPVDERLPTDVAAPCLVHLLESQDHNNSNTSTGQTKTQPRQTLTANAAQVAKANKRVQKSKPIVDSDKDGESDDDDDLLDGKRGRASDGSNPEDNYEVKW